VKIVDFNNAGVITRVEVRHGDVQLQFVEILGEACWKSAKLVQIHIFVFGCRDCEHFYL
jgi:hypothetical protein